MFIDTKTCPYGKLPTLELASVKLFRVLLLPADGLPTKFVVRNEDGYHDSGDGRMGAPSAMRGSLQVRSRQNHVRSNMVH